MNRRAIPFLADATVVQQDPDNYRLWVSIDALGGQILALPVDVLTHGPRDAVRGDFPPLPLPGTRGLVAFTRGDDRTGRWLGAQAAALPDASALSPGQGSVRYRAENSGAWRWHDPASGLDALAWPDGSTLLVGPAGAAMPAPTRHVVTPSGAAARSPFTAAQRNPAPPSAFGFTWSSPSGASVAVTPAGAVAFTAAAGQPVTLAVAGGASIVIGADGSITMADAAGQPAAVRFGELLVDGDVVANVAGGAGAQVSLANHRTSGVTAGGAQSGPPVPGT